MTKWDTMQYLARFIYWFNKNYENDALALIIYGNE